MILTKEKARELVNGDFVPNGKELVDARTLKFRKTKEHEVCRCHARVGYDPQSGPLYCGNIAEFVSETKEVKEDVVIIKRVALCGRGWHKPLKGTIIE